MSVIDFLSDKILPSVNAILVKTLVTDYPLDDVIEKFWCFEQFHHSNTHSLIILDIFVEKFFPE